MDGPDHESVVDDGADEGKHDVDQQQPRVSRTVHRRRPDHNRPLHLRKKPIVAPGTYTPNEDTGEYDAVTFVGTAGRDTLIGGGGELFDFFLGTRGDDLYGSLYGSLDGSEDILANGYADYSAAPRGIIVDMSYRGSATFTDEAGVSRTVATVGQVKGGFGGTDQFTELFEDFSSVFGVFGTSRRDVMIAGGGIDDFFGGGGNDLLIGGFAHGGTGNDRPDRQSRPRC